MTAPVTVADYKAYAGVSSNNQDALIGTLLVEALAAIGNFCNRSFPSAAALEFRDGTGSASLTLARYPVTEFTSLRIDGRDIPASVNGGAGYVVPTGSRKIVLRGYRFSEGLRNVELLYTAGYGDTGNVAPWPEDLKLAIKMYVKTRIAERDRLGVGSKALAGESITIADAGSGTNGSSQGIPAAARLILENYLNTVPETGQ